MFVKKVLWLTPWVVVALCLWPGIASTDQAQYFYDELGRLVGVVDGQGNTAVYVYDEVGNLLRIDRFAGNTGGVAIFLVTPPKGFAPSSGVTPTNVEIRGVGFSATLADNVVKFNGTTAVVVSATATSIVTTVPTGATTGPITVTNASGTATSPQAFTVLVPPIITGVNPAVVPQGATSRVAIEGFHLENTLTVTFTQPGLTASLPFNVTANRLEINLTVGVTVPVNQAYPFSVTTLAGVAESGAIAVTVTGAAPSVGLGKASVFKPFPAQASPSGPSVSVTPPTSVQMP